MLPIIVIALAADVNKKKKKTFSEFSFDIDGFVSHSFLINP